MNKLSMSLVAWACLGISQIAYAGWQDDCKAIENGAPSPGACSAIQSVVSGLSTYAPLKPFEDTTLNPSTLSSQLGGTPSWGGSGGSSSGSSGGSTSVLAPDTSQEQSSSSSSTSNSSDTFQ